MFPLNKFGMRNDIETRKTVILLKGRQKNSQRNAIMVQKIINLGRGHRWNTVKNKPILYKHIIQYT